MADENPEKEIVDAVAEVAAAVVEEANERAEIGAEVNEVLVTAQMEDARERRLQEMDERILECQSRIEAQNQTTETRLSEMTTMQREMMERLQTLSTPPASPPPPIVAEVIEQPDALAVAPVKTENLPEAPEVPEVPIVEEKPETKGVPGKRKIRLL